MIISKTATSTFGKGRGVWIVKLFQHMNYLPDISTLSRSQWVNGSTGQQIGLEMYHVDLTTGCQVHMKSHLSTCQTQNQLLSQF